MNGKERNSNQPHNWEIMHTLLFRAGVGLSLHSYFPIDMHAAVFVISKRTEKMRNAYMVSLLSTESSIYSLADLIEGDLRLNKCIQLLTFNFVAQKHITYLK